ncbi:transcription/translation regulatory transformer protein RfaH [Pseudomonas sp. CCC2.2]|uniref:transcription/translation regulatory transformer protein RfaH n=1 Tax=Pseudomonas sp. CCC2.2 TaxID=3048605 RepID=UPI002B23A7F0|nr:transcription/translation regulatory transformer protein RfaH [Pseudomonas sp. CCC2.2]MEB0146552.1 transcription/translation regulatory transformer protein RfaH [Pseudomonas sp. CCC2.2]
MNIYPAEGASTCAQQKSWYLVQCKPRQDERAEDNLARQGYEISRPKCRYQRLIRGQRQWTVESLFPGYLFINLPADSNWGPLRSTRGVSRVVSFGGVPVAVSDSLIKQLQARAEIDAKPELKPGDNVRITEGGFAELNAVFMAIDGEERVILLINLLNRQQQISLPVASICSNE